MGGAVLVIAGVVATAMSLGYTVSRDDGEAQVAAVAPQAPALAVAPPAPLPSLAETIPTIPVPDPVPTTAAPPVDQPLPPISLVPPAPQPDWTPLAVRIPEIGVDAPVDPMGVDAENALEVPTDTVRVGWWSGGAQPGQADPSVLVGHRDSSTGPAVFIGLDALEPGDEIEVDRADGSTARFAVERLESHPKTEFPTLSVYGETDASTLRLVTCFGAFDDVARSYDDNLVVYANLIV